MDSFLSGDWVKVAVYQNAEMSFIFFPAGGDCLLLRKLVQRTERPMVGCGLWEQFVAIGPLEQEVLVLSLVF